MVEGFLCLLNKNQNSAVDLCHNDRRFDDVFCHNDCRFGEDFCNNDGRIL